MYQQPGNPSHIEIVVQAPDDRVGTPGSSTTPLRRMPSPYQMRTDMPLGSSTSCASSTMFYPASPTQGTTLRSGSSSTRNASSANLKKENLRAEPISASEVKRNDRKRTIPKPICEAKIARGEKTVFNHPQTVGDWVPNVHPDGALYFFHPECRIYTDADLLDEEERSIIDDYARQLLQQADEIFGFPSTTRVLVLERTDGGGCGYYFVEPGNRSIFWLEDVPIKKLTQLPRVDSLAHIKYLMEAEYWMHCMHFPNTWSVTRDVVSELEQMVIHAIADYVPSTTSVIPFDQEELAKIFDLTDRLKDAIKEDFPHAKCVVARFMHDFALAKFFDFYGQPWARLNSDQSIFSNSKPQRSLITKILSLGLFWAPCDYAKESDGIWMDEVVNRIMWRRFIANLNSDWAGLALSATVILNANVAFLALAGDNAVAKSFSFVSTVTSVGVVLVRLVSVRQSQRQDSAEQEDKFLGKMSISIFKTEILAIIFSLPYALLLWSMVWFIIAFAMSEIFVRHLID